MARLVLITAFMAAGLAGCGALERFAKPEAAVEPVAAPVVLSPVLGVGVSADALDQTTAAEKSAALQGAGGGTARELGRVVVALGSPVEQGYWLKSALIVAPAKGRVVTEAGASVVVDLLPGSGAALLSLAAFRVLGLGLTDLPEVTVYAE